MATTYVASFRELLAIDIESPADWDDDQPPMVGGHEDLVP